MWSYYIPATERPSLNNMNQFYSSLCLYPFSLSFLGESERWGCEMLLVLSVCCQDKAKG